MFLCDMDNAEKLLAVALNLINLCSKGVQSYGTEMRSAYREVVEHKGIRGIVGCLSSSTGSLIGLASLP